MSGDQMVAALLALACVALAWLDWTERKAPALTAPGDDLSRDTPPSPGAVNGEAQRSRPHGDTGPYADT